MGFVVSSLIKITYIFLFEANWETLLIIPEDVSTGCFRLPLKVTQMEFAWRFVIRRCCGGVAWQVGDTLPLTLSVREHVIGYIAYGDAPLWPTIYLSCTLLTYLRLFHSSVFDSFLNLKYIHAYVQLAFSFHPNSLECGAFHNATWFFFLTSPQQLRFSLVNQ